MKFLYFMVYFQHLVHNKHYCPTFGLACWSTTKLLIINKLTITLIIFRIKWNTYTSLEQIRKYNIIISIYFFWKSLYLSNFSFLLLVSNLSKAFKRYLRSTQTYNTQNLGIIQICLNYINKVKISCK